MSADHPLPLAHLRVLDCTDLRGALAGRMLADLGADVVKVERPDGDPDRRLPPRPSGSGREDASFAFLVRHANKRAVTLAPESPEGRERLARLCDQADVLLENFDAAVRTALGFEPAAVRARHPGLVHVAIADCGLRGPRAGWRLEPLPALAASGALYASGSADQPPCGVPGYLAHDCAAAFAAVGALAAVRERRHTGAGQTVEVSVEEAALAGLTPWAIPLVDYARTYPLLPEVLTRDGAGPAVVVRTADGWVRFLAITPHQWRALVRLLTGRTPAPEERAEAPRPHAANEPVGLVASVRERGEQLAGLAVGALARLPLHGSMLPVLHAGLDVVRRVAGVSLRRRWRAEVIEAAARLGLPLAPVQQPDEFVRSEQTRLRQYFQSGDVAGLPAAPLAPFPCRSAAATPAVRRGAPAPGEDAGEPFPPRGASTPATAGPARGLTGLRVVDLGVGAVVPEFCRQLAELGADVVKIEPIGTLDFLRRITVEPARPNRSWMFNDSDRGRRSVALDLRQPEGRALALRLCAAADVVAENRTAGVVEHWGLGYDDVRALRPDVVYVSSQGYGRGGPLGTAPAYGPLAAAFAGVSWLWSDADAAVPLGTSLEHPDHFAGRLIAVAVLAALEHRDRTGEGQHLECAQTEAAAFPLGELYADPAAGGARGSYVPHACPHGVYPAAGDDRWIAVAVVGDDAWQRLRSRLGWPDQPDLASLRGRLARRRAIDRWLATWTTSRDAAEAAAELQAVGVSAMPVQGPRELRADPHLAARGALVTVDDPEMGPVRHVGSPLVMSATPAGAAGPAPVLGADGAVVLAEWLQIERSETDALRRRGVLG